MKARFLGILFAACAMFTANSCEKEIIEREIIYDSTVTKTYDIMSRNWKAQDECFTVTLDVPEITRNVVETGSIQCFLVYEDGVQASIPMQRFLSYEYIDEATGKTMTGYYQKMIDYEFTVGQINLFYTMSDFYYENAPEEMTVRVIVHY